MRCQGFACEPHPVALVLQLWIFVPPLIVPADARAPDAAAELLSFPRRRQHRHERNLQSPCVFAVRLRLLAVSGDALALLSAEAAGADAAAGAAVAAAADAAAAAAAGAAAAPIAAY